MTWRTKIDKENRKEHGGGRQRERERIRGERERMRG